ncbi:AhpC/TSA family protein [Subsaxibacter sp. CAU 1640]|uniref:TlpA disulfide reductase family protein n=1 Tax=Subsaxibacter sp. CAU 1640 TaxID=2933271 RepID=UPI0020033512|nr:TlpA disulfide reductase family protein [Subsaxibacter sp. CAU 1640]MCK7590698.1 AhpC/TSA family protein [Subsaxibacter sp. CAU 1640]
MRKIISILTIALLLMACDEKAEKTDGYVINGTAKGVYNGMRVYLKASDERSSQKAQDTAIVMDEVFKFEGKVDYPQMWYISVSNVNGFVPIMVENETIEVNFNKEVIDNSTVTGTKANEALSKYSKGFKLLLDKRNDISKQFSATMNSTNTESREEISKKLGEVNAELSTYPFKFLKTNSDTYFSLSLIDNILKSNPIEFNEIDEAFAKLDTDIKNSPYGKTVQANLEALKKKNEGLAMLNIGKVAPDFTAPDPDGNQISMHNIRGKATIIDFWASWCGPCRRENPNVVKVYEKFHNKGLEIISVSLDKPGQKDNWLKAIADDKLNWHHVSNLNYFQDPVALQYNIQSIPATYILDAEGKIVAKSLRGQALEDKIAEMLN